jgi:hypothetical protein
VSQPEILLVIDCVECVVNRSATAGEEHRNIDIPVSHRGGNDPKSYLENYQPVSNGHKIPFEYLFECKVLCVQQISGESSQKLIGS